MYKSATYRPGAVSKEGYKVLEDTAWASGWLNKGFYPRLTQL